VGFIKLKNTKHAEMAVKYVTRPGSNRISSWCEM